MEHKVKVAENVSISLSYSAGTGYSWLYEKPAELDLVSDSEKNLAAPGMCGGKLVREVVVSPVTKGTFTLHCILVRPWDMAHPAETQDHVIIAE